MEILLSDGLPFDAAATACTAAGQASAITPRQVGVRTWFRAAWMGLSTCRLLPHVLFLLGTDGGAMVRQDLIVWARILHQPAPDKFSDLLRTFVYFMTFTKEFRNLFYLRCGHAARLFAPLCPRLHGLEIECPSIGPGLFIQHGENTFVSARRIGANCWIGRHVVIGYSNETDMPALGDNVRVFAGAKIIGRVEVGDNATVGLNTVVTGNVAPGTTVLGVPGRVIWRKGAAPIGQARDATA